MTIDKDELLSKLKELLKNELSTISYDTWILPLEIDNIKDNHIVFLVKSDFQRDFIENKFNSLIFNTLRYITNKEWTFSVIDISTIPPLTLHFPLPFIYFYFTYPIYTTFFFLSS